MSLPHPLVLVITDRRQTHRSLEEITAAAFAGGCRWLSLREKDLPSEERLHLLTRLVALGRHSGAMVMVHEDIAAARATRAAGVHLPSGGSPIAARAVLGPSALIGLSAHSESDVARAAEEGADYVTLSPIFVSASKPGYGPALGLAELTRIARATVLPIIALGGIGPAEAAACVAAGAAGVATMGAVMTSADPARATAAFVEAVARPCRH